MKFAGFVYCLQHQKKKSLMFNRLSVFKSYVQTGRENNIPLCCSARFAWDAIRPRPLGYLFPRQVRRLGRLSPRMAFAVADQQGYVPCEFHLAKWIVLGMSPEIPQDEHFVFGGGDGI